MQQLQKPVLNKIQPGINPIFIISPNRNDGNVLASLLSNHILLKNDILPTNDQDKNYFVSNDSIKIPFEQAEGTAEQKEEFRAILKLVVEQGVDSKKLWGLQFDYDVFLNAELYNLFPNAFFVFLYGSKITKYGVKSNDKNYDTLQQIYDVFCRYQQRSALISINNIIYIPDLILTVLPFSNEVTISPVSITNENNEPREDSWLLHFNENEQANRLKMQLDENNQLATHGTWMKASEISFILITENADNDSVLKKLFQVCGSFQSTPEIHLICGNVNERKSLGNLIANSRIQADDIHLMVHEASVFDTVNKLVAATTCSYVVVDTARLYYSLANVLVPFTQQHAPAFTFGNLEIDRINTDISTQLSLIDILTVRSIPANISFPKSVWQQVNGFDTALNDKVAVWDFCIRALSQPAEYALETQAIDMVSDHTNQLIHQTDIYESYKPIIEKHKYLFEEKLNQVIKAFSENQFLPHNEIMKLRNNINALNLLLSHSKDELRSVNELKEQLQEKITLLERKWYNRVARKLSHFKRIFFKKKSERKGGIMRFVKLIFFAFTKPGLKIVRKFVKGFFKKMYLISEDRPVNIVYLDEGENDEGETFHNYHDWITSKLRPSVLRREYDEQIGNLKVQPKISIIMPVYNPPPEFLKAAIESVISQLYKNWELCIADDHSSDPVVHRLINSYCFKDKRIKAIFREENGHISACSNSALAMASGDYIFCLDHDDVLTPNCTFEVVKHINTHPEDDIIYSDEDKMDEKATYSLPYFKPDWAPDNLLAKNYITHIAVYKKALMDRLGGYRLGFEGSQDYDLILRGSEIAKHIGHIPKVLYHWRIHATSAAQQIDVKPYAFIAAKKALEEALTRRHTPGEVRYLPGLMGYRVKYYVNSYDKVSIIIPTKDQAKLMRNTIESLVSLTDYPNYEILVLNNNSTTEEFFALMKECTEKYKGIFRCVDAPFPFNFSKLMNVGASHTDGKYILLLNNDVEIIHADWLTKMVAYSQHKQTGAVGVKLLYPDDKIQSAGTVIGLGGVAGHVFVNFFKDDPGYFSYLQSTTNYSAVTAACLMVRRDIYEEVGGMDEALEVEFNDVDFCLKIMDRGYYNVYLPDVVLYHYESATRGHPHQNSESYKRHVRESNYFLEKWEKYIKKDPFYNPNLRYDVQDFRTNFNA